MNKTLRGKVSAKFSRMERDMDRIRESRKFLNNLLEAKFGESFIDEKWLYLDYNDADGFILGNHKEENMPVSREMILALLDGSVSVEDAWKSLERHWC